MILPPVGLKLANELSERLSCAVAILLALSVTKNSLDSLKQMIYTTV